MQNFANSEFTFSAAVPHQALGHMVWGLGSRVHDLGLRVWGFRGRVSKTSRATPAPWNNSHKRVSLHTVRSHVKEAVVLARVADRGRHLLSAAAKVYDGNARAHRVQASVPWTRHRAQFWPRGEGGPLYLCFITLLFFTLFSYVERRLITGVHSQLFGALLIGWGSLIASPFFDNRFFRISCALLFGSRSGPVTERRRCAEHEPETACCSAAYP